MKTTLLQCIIHNFHGSWDCSHTIETKIIMARNQGHRFYHMLKSLNGMLNCSPYTEVYGFFCKVY